MSVNMMLTIKVMATSVKGWPQEINIENYAFVELDMRDILVNMMLTVRF